MNVHKKEEEEEEEKKASGRGISLISDKPCLTKGKTDNDLAHCFGDA